MLAHLECQHSAAGSGRFARSAGVIHYAYTVVCSAERWPHLTSFQGPILILVVCPLGANGVNLTVWISEKPTWMAFRTEEIDSVNEAKRVSIL